MRDNKFNGVDSHTAENRRKIHWRKSPPDIYNTNISKKTRRLVD
jgi:hypothetical protein